MDIVAHGMGVTLAREWVRPDGLGCGPFGCLPTVDSYGQPPDFSISASIPRAYEFGLANQSSWDFWGFTAHIGIANSPSPGRPLFPS